MSTVYSINNNTSDEEFLIPSMKYVKTLAKQIEDMLVSNSSNYLQTINTEVKELPVGIKEINNIDAKKINTDSTHLFVSEEILNKIDNRVSLIDIEKLLNEYKLDMKNEVNNIYNKLINDARALQKLRNIIYLLNEEDTLKSIVNTLSNKIDNDDLEEHINSDKHVSNKDRENLDMLLSFVRSGGVDWNADKDSICHINNKPSSLPANGGNADSIDGFTSEEVVNKLTTDLIIGIDLNNYYDESSVDLLINYDISPDELITELNTKSGIIHFRRGTYSFDNFVLSRNNGSNEIIIEGEYSNTVFILNKFLISNNMTIKDIAIINSDITISKTSVIDNVVFRNCNINIESAENSIIRNCRFNNCNITFNGSCINNMITNNTLSNSSSLDYIGGNNMISNNLYY